MLSLTQPSHMVLESCLYHPSMAMKAEPSYMHVSHIGAMLTTGKILCFENDSMVFQWLATTNYYWVYSTNGYRWLCVVNCTLSLTEACMLCLFLFLLLMFACPLLCFIYVSVYLLATVYIFTTDVAFTVYRCNEWNMMRKRMEKWYMDA